ncbi:MAG: hypothetical protein E7564_01870 [Ruminococcaceae bacterium]|nr:hypothetical protein [Oscillospiraceae bacterium]
MKKIIVMITCILILQLLAGCGVKGIEGSVSSRSENAEQTVSEKLADSSSGTKKTESNQASESSLSSENPENNEEKLLLKLICYPTIETEEAEPTESEEKIVDIAYNELTEITGAWYSDNPELMVFSDYIKNTLNVELNEDWQVTVHFYDSEKTLGLVKFLYYIGDEIATNKCIIFNLSNGKADVMYYSCLNGKTDEAQLKSRVNSFKEKHKQEKYQLNDEEKLEEEFILYIYRYDTDELTYDYNVVFLNEWGVYNNDYGTFCLIDEEGNAIQPYYEE